jgi:hypothetical protein
MSKVSYITDSRWTLHTSWAIIHQRNMQLDKFRTAIEQNKFYAIEEHNSHLYYSFPPGTSLLCAPLILILDFTAKHIYYLDISQLLSDGYFGGIELFLAAFFVAFATVFLYLILRQWKIDEWLIWFCLIVFAFGTSTWSTASRGLFAHGPSMFFLLAGLWSLNKTEKNISWLFAAGFIFSFSYLIRPTNSVSLSIFGLYVLWTYRAESWRFVAASIFVLIPFFLYNYHVYGTFLSNYYMPSHMGSDGSFVKGLAGNLFSPSRGLFIYSPVFLLLIPLIFIQIKKRTTTSLWFCMLIVVLLHTYVISSFNNWYAGWCFGARYFAEIIPYLICLLALGLQTFLETEKAFAKTAVIISFATLSIISCWINYQGANNSKTFEWNYSPNSIDDNRERVWDWNDIQFLRK